MIVDDLEQPEVWPDLWREARSMGALAALLVLEPWALPKVKFMRWRELAAQGLAALEAEVDDETDFHRDYYRAVDGVFDALMRRQA